MQLKLHYSIAFQNFRELAKPKFQDFSELEKTGFQELAKIHSGGEVLKEEAASPIPPAVKKHCKLPQ